MGTTTRPWLAAALFCENVLEEKDNVLSLIRVVHKVTVSAFDEKGQPLPFPKDGAVPVPLTAFVGLRGSGEAGGPHSLKLVAIGPTGKRTEMASYEEINFLTGDQSVNLIFRMGSTFREGGLYWFDVLLDGELVTRMPLQVEFAHQETMSETSEAQTETPRSAKNSAS